MREIVDLQRWLYSGALDALTSLGGAGWSGVLTLIGLAFCFGMLHALLPGHGKAVLVSYYAGDGRYLGAIVSSAIVILTHVGSAIVLVLGGFAVLQRTIGGAGRAPALEQASQVLIVVIGLWLLWRALRPHVHDRGRSAPFLAFVAGLVPCPLTTFIMTYAITRGLVVSGLVLSGAFAAGMIATVAVFPVLAVLLRARFMDAMERTEGWRGRAGKALEVTAACAVVAIGLWPLLR